LVSQFLGSSAGLPDREIPSLKLWLSVYTLSQNVKNGSIWKVDFLRVASLKRCCVKLSFHFLSWLLSSLLSFQSDASNLSTRTSGCCRLPCSRVSEEKSDVGDQRSRLDGCDHFESRMVVNIAVGGHGEFEADNQFECCVHTCSVNIFFRSKLYLSNFFCVTFCDVYFTLKNGNWHTFCLFPPDRTISIGFSSKSGDHENDRLFGGYCFFFDFHVLGI
jgi:hypothetical protein